MNDVSEDGVAHNPLTEDLDRQAPVVHESIAELRLRRIEDLQAEALAKPDALEANLGVFNGGLMRMGLRLEEAIEGTLADIVDPLIRFETLNPALESYLKIMRQIDRFAQLDQRLAAARPDRGHPKPR